MGEKQKGDGSNSKAPAADLKHGLMMGPNEHTTLNLLLRYTDTLVTSSLLIRAAAMRLIPHN